MEKKKIIALGFFDGVHLGHQALLAECVRLARAHDCQPAAITFLQHPQSLFVSEPPALLTGAADRDALLGRYGMEQICKLPVTEEVMSTPWETFLEQLLEQGAAGFICGHDFRFGHRGEGSPEKLTRFCAGRDLPCTVVPGQALDGIRISSTHIRGLIEAGEMETAVRFLGHPHILTGTVVSGRHLGRTIGVPTANLLLPEGLVVPRFGVYACRCRVDGGVFSAVTNIGTRPTVGGHRVTVEPWILDFDGDLYGKEITLEFYKFLRPERKFDSLEELKAQIQRDAADAQLLLRQQAIF